LLCQVYQNKSTKIPAGPVLPISYIYINGFIVIFSIALTVSTSKQQLPMSNSYNIADSNLRLICDVCKSLLNQDASKWGNTSI